MTWHVVCLAGESDKYVPRLSEGEASLVVPLDVREHPDAVSTKVPDVFAAHGIEPSVPAHDFLNAAIVAYTADVRVPRKAGFDRWTRDIRLHLAVRSTDGWAEGTKTLERLLSFLTGDHWEVEVRQSPRSYVPVQARPPRVVQPLTTTTVCLFSGGLDSFVGAVDEVERIGQVALVGHHKSGDGPTSRSQNLALSALRESYSEELTPFLRCWLSPPKGANRASEITTRGRSIMFLGLGIAAASGFGAERLVVPENGLISLNVPLINSRLGSFSTRTTHPHLMRLVRELLAGIGVELEIDLPYRFRTKGEMLRECANQSAMKRGVETTMSCSHPGANRFGELKNPNAHCGRCIPCVIRRAAVSSVMDDPTLYAAADLSQPLEKKTGEDLRALKIALDRFSRRPPRLADILASGPMPGSDDELKEYLGVFSRGITEVESFLRGTSGATKKARRAKTSQSTR